MSSLRSLAALALSAGLATIAAAQASGSGTTTRYWDCCKGSCGWTGKASVSNPVTSCDINDSPITNYNEASGCTGGDAYMCSSQSPWAVNSTFAYGFAAVSIPSETEADWCCACYELTFTSTSIAGKTMIVQATNTGADLAQGQFDLAIPGGGVGIYNGCTDEWGAPSEGWGAQYGGISTDTCSSFPSALRSGCSFRFGDFFEGADNPSVDYKEVTCPAALTDKTGCVRSGTTPTGGDEGSSSSSSSAAAATSSASSAQASSATAATSSSTSSAKASSASAAVSSSASSTVAVSASSSPSAAAPSSSSTTVPSVQAPSTTAIVAPTSSSPSASSIVQPASSSKTTLATSSVRPSSSSSSSVAAPVTTSNSHHAHSHSHSAAWPSESAPADEGCSVQYKYVYDL